MEKLIRFTIADLAKITNHRSGEIKFGQKMHTIPKDKDIAEYIKTCEAPYVLFGIPEDIGVRANYGRPGAASAWKSAIKSIANIQHNRFCKGSRILVLGTLDVHDRMEAVKDLDFNKIDERMKLSQMVAEIDKDVAHIIFTIVSAGKIPIVIGGGHNNAYGNIKGTALAKGKPINAINFVTHSISKPCGCYFLLLFSPRALLLKRIFKQNKIWSDFFGDIPSKIIPITPFNIFSAK